MNVRKYKAIVFLAMRLLFAEVLFTELSDTLKIRKTDLIIRLLNTVLYERVQMDILKSMVEALILYVSRKTVQIYCMPSFFSHFAIVPPAA